jgi:hypothetical protein
VGDDQITITVKQQGQSRTNLACKVHMLVREPQRIDKLNTRFEESLVIILSICRGPLGVEENQLSLIILQGTRRFSSRSRKRQKWERSFVASTVIPSHSSHVFQMTIISLHHLSFTTR